jgi:2-dehydropantoate 2-reductase
VILSALNRITSEAVIGEFYGMDKILYCVTQGMDAVKVGNQLTYEHMGMLSFGDREPGVPSDHVKRVAVFFDKVKVPYEMVPDMYTKLWSKFMLNVGVNQTVAVYQSNYGEIHREGPARERMIAAMGEVMLLSEKEGIHLTEADIDYCGRLRYFKSRRETIDGTRCTSERYSEVELFAGTALKFGKKHGNSTPVNLELYKKIKSIEANY